MKFETFAFLGPVPVHEEPVRQVHHKNRSNHFNANPERGDPRQQSDNQPEAAKELGANDKKCNRSRHSQVLKEPHRAVKSVAAKPSEHFLCAVRKKHNSQNQPQHGESHIVACSQQSLHFSSSPCRAVGSAIVVITTISFRFPSLVHRFTFSWSGILLLIVTK